MTLTDSRPMPASLLFHNPRFAAHHALIHDVFMMLDGGRENNVPTWWNSMLWMLTGALAAIIALNARRMRLSWWAVAAVALFASLDEFVQLHERLDRLGFLLRDFLPFYVPYPWLVVGIPLALLLLGLVFLKLARALPRPTGEHDAALLGHEVRLRATRATAPVARLT